MDKDASYIVSFYGTDGCGKSSIATSMQENNHDYSFTILGGSSYKEWLTDDVADLTLGKDHLLNQYTSEYGDRIRLYEDIAIACYGFARYLRDVKGESTLIDSDPYTKRIIWSGLDDSLHGNYIERFEDKMTQQLGDDAVGPDFIAAINMRERSSDEDLVQRILRRDTSTEHDPKNTSEMNALNTRIIDVWSQIELGQIGMSTIMGFNNRFTKATIFHEANPNCASLDIKQQTNTIARNILQKINSQLS